MSICKFARSHCRRRRRICVKHIRALNSIISECKEFEI